MDTHKMLIKELDYISVKDGGRVKEKQFIKELDAISVKDGSCVME